MLNALRRNRWIPRFTTLLFFWSYGLQAAEIAPDGRTQTSVLVNGNVSDVTTGTVSGVNGYNSFSAFNVYQADVVNLHLPDGTENLLNVVHDQTTTIDGMLNALQNGQVGGNVYFANPHGFVVGVNGVINVGSLSVSTPTSQFLDEFFTSPGAPSAAHTDQLLNYTMPVNDSGLVSIQGTVNAIGDIRVEAGQFDGAGVAQSGAVFAASAPNFSDVVNLADVETGTELSVSNGVIRIVAEDITQSGVLASKGGDISLEGRDITVTGGAEVTAAADAGPSGSVNIAAWDVLAGSDDPTDASSSVVIDSATVRGDDIWVTATASNAREAQGSEFGNAILGGLKLIDLNAFQAGGLQAKSLESSATATIDIGAGANLIADSNLFLAADADSEAKIAVLEILGILLPVGVGGAYAASDATAAATVNAGATLSAGGLINVEATAQNVVEVSSAGLDKGTILLSIAEVTTDSDARIAPGATVMADRVAIGAVSTSDIQNSTAPIPLLGGNTGGIAATWLRSTADAEMGADADLRSLQVDAVSTTTRNTTIAKSKVKEGDLSDRVTKFRNLFAATAKATKVPGGAASAFAIGDSKHTANASIAAGADIDADDIVLQADTVDNFKLIAGSEVETTSFALGSAAAIGEYGNEANAFIGENAVVDAHEQLQIDAMTRVPSQIDTDSLLFWKADGFLEGVASFLGLVADPLGSIAEAFLTTSSISRSTASEGTGIAGMYTGIDLANDVNAYVGNGAQVNTDQSEALESQSVNVRARNAVDAINLAGSIGSGKTLGGAVNDLDFDVDVRAAIADGATVNARGGVNVDAASTETLLNIAVAGGKAQDFGLAGSVNLIDIDNNVQALVDDQANVHAGAVSITASDDANSLAISGGVVKGASTGIGFSWAVNTIKSIVKAFFGDDPDAPLPGTGEPGLLVADSGVTISADSAQSLDSWSLAGSAGGPGTGDAKSTAKGSAGFGASGDVSLNTVEGETAAFVDGGVTVNAGALLDVSASDLAQVNARSGSASLQSGAGSSGIAGSYSENTIDTRVRAFIDNATVASRPDDTYTAVDVTALSDGGISSFAIGGGSSGKVGVAGSVAVNEIGSDAEDRRETEAYIQGSNLERANVDVSASDLRSIDSFAGALSVSGTAGIGPSVSINNTHIDTHAYLDGTTVEQADSIRLAALNDNAIHSFSASAGVGTTSFGGAGSLSYNTIGNSSEAYLRSSEVREALEDVDVNASDISEIRSIAGGGAFGSSVGVAISAAYNDIANRIAAFFDDAAVATDGSVLITADSDADIQTLAVGIGASSSVGVAGSTAISRLSNETSAEIRNASTVTADDDVQVAADSTNRLHVVAGSAGGGSTAGGGGAVVVNVLGSTTTARIEGSTVTAWANGAGVASYSGDENDADKDADGTILVKGVIVDAYNRDDVTTANVNGAGGGTAGVAASTSISTVKDTTTASISSSSINQAGAGQPDAASAEQQVRVAAYERLEFGGGSGNAAGGGTAGVGVGVDSTVVRNTTQAYVDADSLVRAEKAIDIEAAHRENVLSVSVGGAIGGTAGVVGSGNGARLASTTRAYVIDSGLESGGSIGVNAEETAELVQIAGGIAGGGAVGATGAVGVGILENTTEAFLAAGAVTNAEGATGIRASSDETSDHYVISASGGGTAGVAANVSVQVANSTTQAFIDGGARVNQDDTIGSAGQDVTVLADSDLTLLGATGGVSGAGVVGGGAAVDLDFVKNTTTAYVGDGAIVDANGDVTVQADADKDVTAFAVGGGGGGTVGVSAMVSVINVGASLDDDARDEVGSAGGYADGQVSGNTTQGIDANDTFAASAAQEAANDNDGTSVSDHVNDTATASSNRTSAFIGDQAIVDAGNDVLVQSIDKTTVAQNVGGIAVSLGGSVGGSVGIVNTNTYNQALIGTGARVRSGASLDVDADTVNRVDSTAIAGAGGLVGLGAAVAIVSDSSVTLAQLENGVVVDSAGKVSVDADADVDLSTFAFGATAGAGAVGASIARSNSTAITKALVSDSVMIGQTDGLLVGGLAVNAVSDVDADAWAIAGSAGIVSGSGADARSNVDSTTEAGVGESSRLTVAGDVDVTARGLTSGEAQADGVNVAGITVGVSLAHADATPTVLAAVGDQSEIRSGGSITVAAGHNVDAAGQELTGRKMHAQAFSAAGALVGGTGSDAHASVTADVDATTGVDSRLSAAAQVLVDASTVARAEADANGQAYGVAAGGITASEATVDAHTDVTTGANSLIEGADVALSASANLFADSDTTGGNGGLLSVGGTEARSRIDNDVAVTVGSDSILAAVGTVLVEALAALDADSFATITAGGGVTVNGVSAETDIVNATSVDIGQDSTLSGADVMVQALVSKLRAFGKAVSRTVAAGSDSHAETRVDVESDVDVTVRSGAELKGQSAVAVTSRTSGIDLDSIADAKSTGVTGNVTTLAHGDLDADSDIDVQTGSIITSPNISLLAETVSGNGDFNRDSDATANTAVNWVLQKSTTLVRKAEKIPFIGWFFKWVRKTVFTWVAEVLQSDVSAQISGGDPRTDNGIRMDGTLAQLSALSPRLVVNADQTIDSDGNINATIVNGEVVVNGVSNNVVGSIDISSPGGIVSGAGTLLLNKTFDSVDITNNSDLNMRINSIDVLAANAEDPELNINADQDLTTFNVVSEVEVSDVNVQGNSAADIIVAGRISNPAGVTSISNSAGDIYGDGGYIESNKVMLAAGGDIGQDGNLIRLELIRDFENAELTVLAGGSAYLDLQLAEYLNEVPAGHVIDGLSFLGMTAGENLVVELRSGVVYDLPDQPGLEPVPVAVLGRYGAGEVTAGGDIDISEAAQADFGYDLIRSSDGSVSLRLNHGDAALARLEAPNGRVSVVSAGAIVNGSVDAGANIVATDVDLVAGAGIGVTGRPLEIEQSAGGILNAAAAGDVHLASGTGGFGIGLIDALGHLVSLVVNGSLFNMKDDDSENVVAETIVVDADGSVGSGDARLVVDSGDGVAAGVVVRAGSGIRLEERQGDLNSSAMTTTTGSVDLLIVSGSGNLAAVSAPESVVVTALDGSLDIGQIDPADVSLTAGGAAASIDVAAIQAGSSIRVEAATANLGNVTHSGGPGSTLAMAATGDLSVARIDSAAGGIAMAVAGNAAVGDLLAAGDVTGNVGLSLAADRIESGNGSVDLTVGGNGLIGSLVAANDVRVAAGTGLAMAEVSAGNLAFDVAAEGGSLRVGNAEAAGAVALRGDQISVDRLLDVDDGSLQISVTGNDGELADTVGMRIETMGDLLIDVFKSVYAELAAFAGSVSFDSLVVGEIFVLENESLRLTLDYKDNKDNENSETLETRDQPMRLFVEGARVDADSAQNLFVIKEKL